MRIVLIREGRMFKFSGECKLVEQVEVQLDPIERLMDTIGWDEYLDYRYAVYAKLSGLEVDEVKGQPIPAYVVSYVDACCANMYMWELSVDHAVENLMTITEYRQQRLNATRS